MKNERGEIKLITIIVIILLLVLIIFGVVIVAKHKKWKKINLGKWHYETEMIELDLNGDNVNEKISINNTGKYISINNKEYVVNKYINENNKTLSGNYDYFINQYLFVDLNDDGILEIMHKTFSDMISPITSKYTIYNFKDNNLIEIGSISIIGSIPDEIYVKGNTIKFEYWPYESPRDYTEEVVYELNV